MLPGKAEGFPANAFRNKFDTLSFPVREDAVNRCPAKISVGVSQIIEVTETSLDHFRNGKFLGLAYVCLQAFISATEILLHAEFNASV